MYKHETSPNCELKSVSKKKLCEVCHQKEEVPNVETSFHELEKEISDSDSELVEDLESETII